MRRLDFGGGFREDDYDGYVVGYVKEHGDAVVAELAASDARRRRTVWHEHHFSTLCTDEVHGRFDVIENDAGEIFLLDVGADRVVERLRLPRGRGHAARAAAGTWRPGESK